MPTIGEGLLMAGQSLGDALRQKWQQDALMAALRQYTQSMQPTTQQNALMLNAPGQPPSVTSTMEQPSLSDPNVQRALLQLFATPGGMPVAQGAMGLAQMGMGQERPLEGRRGEFYGITTKAGHISGVRKLTEAPPLPGTPSWVKSSTGEIIHRVPQSGDMPYAQKESTPQWVERNKNVAFDVPQEGDKPYQQSGGSFTPLKNENGDITGWVNLKTKEQVTPKDLGLPGDIVPGTLTSTTRTMKETAPKVKGLIGRINPLVEKLAPELGAVQGRLSDLMTGKIGLDNPDYNRLRTDMGLLSTLLMRMHVGARGGQQIMEKFDKLLGLAQQSPENLKAALEEISAYADEVAGDNKKSETLPKVSTEEDYNKLPSGSQYIAPDGSTRTKK